MSSRAKTVILTLSLATLVLSPLAEAARLGKGRSAGMQRTAPTRSYQPQQQAAAPTTPQPMPSHTPAQPQRKGIGVGTAIAGAAATGVAGYALSSALNNPAHAAPAQAAPAAAPASAPATATPAPVTTPATEATPHTSQPAGIPWSWIILLAVIFLVGLMWFRRRMATPGHAPSTMQPAPQPLGHDHRFAPIPNIGSGFSNSSNTAYDTRRLPDGTETPHFLRQAKGIFLHLQSMNSPEALEEVRRYMTPQLFEEIRQDIATNQSMADFTDLDCQLTESKEENGRIVASVHFTGMVSEEVNATPAPFTETWHFIKDATTNGKWIVAGIQQN